MWIPRLINKVLKTLRAESSTIQEAVQKQEAAIRHAAETEQKKSGEIAGIIASAIETAHKDVPGYEKIQRDKEYRLQKRLFWATVGAALVAAIYAAIAAIQMCIMNQTYREVKLQTQAAQCAAKASQQQAKLMMQQLISTQAAVLRVQAQSIGELRPGITDFSISLRNDSHAIASRVEAKFYVIKMRVSDGKIVERSADPIVISASNVLPVDPGQGRGIDRHYPLNLTTTDANKLQQFEMTIGVDGTIHYWNGFDWADDSACYVMQEWTMKDKNGKVVDSANDGFVNCSDFRVIGPQVLKQMHQWQTKTKDNP